MARRMHNVNIIHDNGVLYYFLKKGILSVDNGLLKCRII